MCIGLHVKYPLDLSGFKVKRIFSTDFRKIVKYQVCENASSGSQVVSCRRTDMTKLIVAFRNFADALARQSCYLIATTYILLNKGRIKSYWNEG